MPPSLRSGPAARPSVRPTRREDRGALERLIDSARWRHLHLDWLDPLALLNESPFMLLAAGRQPVACLGCPPDLPRRAWIRVFAASGAVDLSEAWDLLWEATLPAARTCDLVALDVLQTGAWMIPLLRQARFETSDQVVFLERSGPPPLASLPNVGTIRRVSLRDLAQLVALDEQAFPDAWRVSLRSAEAACRTAAYASVLVHDGRLLGYQITSISPYSAHLSRLAVAPDSVRRGLGAALTLDAMHVIWPQRPLRWTVNTQAGNSAALQLYRRLGFQETGLRYPIHTRRL